MTAPCPRLYQALHGWDRGVQSSPSQWEGATSQVRAHPGFDIPLDTRGTVRKGSSAGKYRVLPGSHTEHPGVCTLPLSGFLSDAHLPPLENSDLSFKAKMKCYPVIVAFPKFSGKIIYHCLCVLIAFLYV